MTTTLTKAAPPPDVAATVQPTPQAIAAAVRPRVFLYLVAGLLIGIGSLEMISWAMQWSTLLSLHRGGTPIMFNTSMAVTLTGIALISAQRDWSRVTRLCGGVIAAVAGISFAENAFSWNGHIDQIFVQAYLTGPSGAPGRMALNTSVCLIAIGVAVLVWTPRQGTCRNASGYAATIVITVSLVAMFGYLANLRTAYGWGRYAAMALPTAIAMLVSAAGLLLLGRCTRQMATPGSPARIAAISAVGGLAASGLLWQAFITSTSGSVSRSTAASVVLAVSILGAVLLGLAAWLGQRGQQQRDAATQLAEQLRGEVRLRSEAQAALEDKEHLLTAFLEAMPVAVFIADTFGKPYYANTMSERLLGRGIADVSRSGLSEVYQVRVAGTDLVYPSDRLPVVQALDGRVGHVDDMEIAHGSGLRVPLEVWGSPIFDEAGAVRFGLSCFVDITQRKRDEAVIREKAALLDLAPDALFVRDAGRRITYWSEGARHLYGYTEVEAVGHVSLELLRTELPEPIDVLEERLRATGHWSAEMVQHRKDGRRVVVATNWGAVTDADGHLTSVLVSNTDVTDEKAAQEEIARRAAELERLNVELNRSNTDLEQFAYAASHDLSEPLRAISGPVSLLARRYEDQLDDDAKRFIAFAVDGCERMQVVINDLLTFSRVGRLEGPIQDVDLNDIATTVLVSLQPLVEGSGADITVELLPTLPGEATQLRQLLQNLISNAIKFVTPGEHPRIHVSARPAGDSWCVTVTDNGIGIEPQHRERIFGMFKRLHSRDAYPGTGIGLALCKKIVERHGGQIGVDDAPAGGGSLFWFTLPTTREDEK